MEGDRPEPTDQQVGRMADILKAAYPRSYPDLKTARRAVRHCHWVLANYGPEPSPSVVHRFI